MIRGIERRSIFLNTEDRENLIERMATLLPETKTICYAWVFIPNHAHFLFRSGTNGLSALMRRLLTGYAVSFNLRHNRHGQLFQNRYKSIICQEDPYLKELVRYIHLNPIRANLIPDLKELNQYPYSGHMTLMGKMKQPWQDVDYVLKEFGDTASSARRGYLAYMQEGLEQGKHPELSGGGLIRSLGGWAEIKAKQKGQARRLKGDERILGDSDFVTQVLAEADEQFDRKYKLKSLGFDFKKLVKQVSDDYELSPAVIFSNSRNKRIVEARSLICYFAVRQMGVSLTLLAKEWGASLTAVSYAVSRGEKIASDKSYHLKI
jgi:REP element-mobilizing transposase RayT